MLTFLLAGCSGPIGLYHDIEGGAIAQSRQAPPGANLPYPNLADVPPAPAPMPAGQANVITEQARSTATGISPASQAALEGLELPGAPPPLPDVPGLNLPAIPSTPAQPAAIAAAPPAKPQNSVPVAIAFPPGSAILPYDDATAITAIAGAYTGQAKIRAGGFGDGISLSLALARAQRLADALTARGVPPSAIQLVAMEAGSGGFVQLVY